MKALLVGINEYLNAKALQGCANDVRAMSAMLKQRYAAKDGDIKILLDGEATEKAIKDGLRWLAEPHGDSGPRLFHYSGHGTQVPDKNGDEKDGADECLVPVNYEDDGAKVKNVLLDDELRALYRRFDPETHLLLVMDSCHSGTVDKDVSRKITYRFVKPSRAQRKAIREAEKKSRAGEKASIDDFVEKRVEAAGGTLSTDDIKKLVSDAVDRYEKKHYGLDTRTTGNAVLIAGCRANQTSADAPFGNSYQGALTYYLLEALKDGASTYGDLITKVGDLLADDDFDQVPQLGCTEESRGKSFLTL